MNRDLDSGLSAVPKALGAGTGCHVPPWRALSLGSTSLSQCPMPRGLVLGAAWSLDVFGRSGSLAFPRAQVVGTRHHVGHVVC